MTCAACVSPGLALFELVCVHRHRFVVVLDWFALVCSWVVLVRVLDLHCRCCHGCPWVCLGCPCVPLAVQFRITLVPLGLHVCASVVLVFVGFHCVEWVCMCVYVDLSLIGLVCHGSHVLHVCAL